MSNNVVPHHGGKVVPHAGGGGTAPSSGAPEQATAKVIPYTEQGPVGWDRMPKEVAQRVHDEVTRRAQCTAPTGQLAAGSTVKVTRRRPDRSTYQTRSGWWCSTELLCEVEVRRSLQELPDGRFKPAGSWQVHEMRWYQLVEPVTKTRRYDAGGGAESPSAPASTVTTHDPLEVIPPSAVAMVRDGLRGKDCWQSTWPEGKAAEIVVAYAIVDMRLTVLHAQRVASAVENLGSAPWSVTVTRAGLEPLAVDTPAADTGPPAAPRLAGRAARLLGR